MLDILNENRDRYTQVYDADRLKKTKKNKKNDAISVFNLMHASELQLLLSVISVKNAGGGGGTRLVREKYVKYDISIYRKCDISITSKVAIRHPAPPAKVNIWSAVKTPGNIPGAGD